MVPLPPQLSSHENRDAAHRPSAPRPFGVYFSSLLLIVDYLALIDKGSSLPPRDIYTHIGNLSILIGHVSRSGRTRSSHRIGSSRT